MEAPKRDQIPCAQKYSLVVRENNGATVYMYPAVQGNFGLVCEFLQRIQYPGVELVSVRQPLTGNANIWSSFPILIPASNLRITRAIKAM